MRDRPGRPPKPTDIDESTMQAARRALLAMARELHLPTGRYPDPDRDGRMVTMPAALDLAVLAVTASHAFDQIAGEHVERAREHDDITWAQVGEAFDTSMQSAHNRFRKR